MTDGISPDYVWLILGDRLYILFCGMCHKDMTGKPRWEFTRFCDVHHMILCHSCYRDYHMRECRK